MKARKKSDSTRESGGENPIGSHRDANGVRVICVDDHAVLIEGLRARFAMDGRITLVGHLESAEGLLAEIERCSPDVLLLDIEMPGPDVFETADRVRHEHPGIPFVFLSAHIRDGYLAAAYKCGGSGYFSKSEELNDIVDGIERVARSTSGTFILTPKVRMHCMPGHSERVGTRRCTPSTTPPSGMPVETPLQTLTSRELEIVRLIGKGLSRVQIAEQLARSPKTIDGHQERIMKKLNIVTRTELMRFAIREGLAEA